MHGVASQVTSLHTMFLIYYMCIMYFYVLSVQVHSITARSVSRQFRESLKIGKPEKTDAIFKLPEAKQNLGTQDIVKNSNNVKAGKVCLKMW